MPLKESTSSLHQHLQQQKDIYSFNVCLVGLSGTESYKGIEGIGKSCVCSRFIANKEDDYRNDHISNISLSDWHSLVVNRNHWLYWGHKLKQINESLDLIFHLVEQTEFISDESMHPFDEADLQPYYKRCANVKLTSPQKCVYRRKEQFALQEYNYGKFPSESMIIDGFICVFDVTEVQRRNFQNQLNEIQQILMNLIKTKKPIVIITTKNDNFKTFKHDYLLELEKLLLKKEFNKSTTVFPQIIETSAHLNINIDLAFYQLALLINKTLNKYRSLLIPTTPNIINKFQDAYENYLEFMQKMKHFYQSLLNTYVNTYKFKYEQFYVLKKYELNQLIDLFGIDYILKEFNNYLDLLKEQYKHKKLNGYLNRLPHVIECMYDNDTDRYFYMNNSWSIVRDNMKRHKLFEKFIIKLPNGSNVLWYENELFDVNMSLIPNELFVLYDVECKQVFDSFVENFKNLIKVNEAKIELFNLLKANALKNNIQPGKQWNESNVFFIGRDCYEYLTDEQRRLVYEQFQKEFISKTKLDYVEALNENCEIFLNKIYSSNITSNDIDYIMQLIKHDRRHLALEKLQEERKGLLLKHIAFLLGKSKSLYCSYGSLCVDSNINNYINTKCLLNNDDTNIHENFNQNQNNNQLLVVNNVKISLIILINKCLTSYLIELVKNLLEKERFHFMNYEFNINYKIINSEVQFDDDNLLNDFIPDGIICGCNDYSSFNFIKNNINKLFKQKNALETTCWISHLNYYDCNNINDDVLTSDVNHLYKNDLKMFCKKSNYKFVDNCDEIKMQNILNEIATNIIENESKHLTEVIINKANIESLPVHTKIENDLNNNNNSEEIECETDEKSKTVLGHVLRKKRLNILCCIMCENDTSMIDTVLSPFFDQTFYHINHKLSTSTNSILIETFNSFSKQMISIEIISYHLAFQYLHSKKILEFDGFILVYSVKRLASFENARSLGERLIFNELHDTSNEEKKLKTIPICIVAVTNQGLSDIFADELSSELLQSGNKLADQINSRFITASSQFSNQSCAFNPFFEDCFTFKKYRKTHFIKSLHSPTNNMLHMQQQQIEIVLEDYNKSTDDLKYNHNYNTEIVITPLQSLMKEQTQNLELPIRANKIRSTSADIYLASPKVKSSSSSSNLSIHFEHQNNIQQNNSNMNILNNNNNNNNNNNQINKLQKSAIYSTESVASTSSLSSNLLNSSPSPSYQRNKSQELIDNHNSRNEAIVSNELKIPKTFQVPLLSRLNVENANESHRKSNHTIELTQMPDDSSLTKNSYLIKHNILNESDRNFVINNSHTENHTQLSETNTLDKNDNSKRRLPNAPLARAESIDLEAKKLYDQQQKFNEILINKEVTDDLDKNTKKYSKKKGENKSDYDSEEYGSSMHGNLNSKFKPKHSLNIDDLNLNNSLSPTKPSLYKKTGKKPTPYKFKSKTSKLFKHNNNENAISNDDNSIENKYFETEDLLDDEQNKTKKLKRKKSNPKIKSQIFNRGGGGAGDVENNKTSIANKSLDDLLVISSAETTQISNYRTEESEDGCNSLTTTSANMTTSSSANSTGGGNHKKYHTSMSNNNGNSNISSPIPLIISSPQQQQQQTHDFSDGCGSSTRHLSQTTNNSNNNLASAQLAQQIASLANSLAACNSTSSTNFLNSSHTNIQSTSNRRSYANNEHCIENDMLSNNTGIPYIVEKCIAYIEEFGLESEGIYRVPGHKQYTDSLFDDFINRQESIDLKSYSTSQINVNIVATVIKEYFRHLKEPIIGNNLKDFTDLSKTHFGQNTNYLISQQQQQQQQQQRNNSTRQLTPPLQQQTQQSQQSQQTKKPINTQDISQPIRTTKSSSSLFDDAVYTDLTQQSQQQTITKQSNDLTKESLIESIKHKFEKLKDVNYLTLKAVFLHLNLIASHSNKNNMDSNNLAICWWPTLLRPKFEDFNETEILRKTLQPLIKFIIDNAKVIFENRKLSNDSTD